jgi:23S rRNA (cytosine1962-C5)-methyltransferase
VTGEPGLGETVDVYSHNGQWLARAAFSPKSQIRARVWTFDKSDSVDQAFFEKRLNDAQLLREYIIERDGLPGITIDKYDNYLVCQLLSAGAEYHKENLVKALVACFPNHNIYERSDISVRNERRSEPSHQCRRVSASSRYR